MSPTVTTETIEGGTEVTIHYEGGEVSFDVMNGEQGEQGEPGEGLASGGTTGQVLKKRSNADYDTEWANESGTVLSVNGKTGSVVLDADDVGALPDDTPIPSKTSDLVNDSGYITSAPVASVDGKTGDVSVLPSGGTTGQALVKSSGTDYATEWDSISAEDVGAMPKWNLLWTNQNPTSTFAAQTVNVDLTNYDSVLCIFRGEKGTGSLKDLRVWSFTTKGFQGNANYFWGDASKGGHRTWTTSNSGVQFGTGYNYGSSNNDVFIPLVIYGIVGITSQ